DRRPIFAELLVNGARLKAWDRNDLATWARGHPPLYQLRYEVQARNLPLGDNLLIFRASNAHGDVFEARTRDAIVGVEGQNDRRGRRSREVLRYINAVYLDLIGESYPLLQGNLGGKPVVKATTRAADPVRNIQPENFDAVWSAAFSPDGKKVAFGTSEGSVFL